MVSHVRKTTGVCLTLLVLIVACINTSFASECLDAVGGNIDVEVLTAGPGEDVAVTIRLNDTPNDVFALGFDLEYDATRFVFADTVVEDCMDAFTHFDCREFASGVVRCGGFDTGSGATGGTTCYAVTVYFAMNEQCVPGACDDTFSVNALVDDIASWSATHGCFCCECASDADCPQGYECKGGVCAEKVSMTDPPDSGNPGGGGGSGPATTTVPSETTTTTTIGGGDGPDEPAVTTTTTVPGSAPETSTTTTVEDTDLCFLESLGVDESALATLRRFRSSRMLSSKEGLLLVTLYYRHSSELNHILYTNPELGELVRVYVENESVVLDRGLQSGNSVVLSADKQQKLISILKKIRVHAKPALQKSLAILIKQVQQKTFMNKVGCSIK